MPSSRCTTVSAQCAQLVAIGLGHAEHLADDVHRQLAGEVADEVAAPALDEARRCARRASARMRGSSSAMRRGVKPRDTSARMRVWRGGSMARNDIVACALGCRRLPGRARRRCDSRSASVSRKRGEHVGVARQRPEAERARCGRRGASARSRRRSGTGPRGSRRRRDRTRACWSRAAALTTIYILHTR